MGRIKHSAAWWCYVRGEMTPERFVRTAAEIGYAWGFRSSAHFSRLFKQHYGITPGACQRQGSGRRTAVVTQ